MIEFRRDNETGKVIFPVPPDIRFISEWEDFGLDLFSGAYIIDKQIPGCGFTEYCLTSPDNVILCSPRKILLENKESQHTGEVFYARNEFETEELQVDKSLIKKTRTPRYLLQPITPEELVRLEELNQIALEKLEKSLVEYCQRRQGEGKPIKIIVTYDSFRHVKSILRGRSEDLLRIFKIVIDEFQSIFVDSRFKADIEFGFMGELSDLSNNICFVSATPMIDTYLKRLDYFKDLPYFELDWKEKDPGRVMQPELKVRKIKSVHSEMKRIIGEYKAGSYSVLANPITGELVQSREAVFYVNSVNEILCIIKSEGLLPGEVNILCSRTPQNEKKLRAKLGKKYQIGSVPLKGEPHKMFTFCTRTVYLGADFYSTNARTFVLSDANIESLSVDISLDLPQILGRQRLLENPWKNHAEFYFKTLGKDKDLSRESFGKILEIKDKATQTLLGLYFKSTEEEKEQFLIKLKRDVVNSNYVTDYVSFGYIEGKSLPVSNILVRVAEERAFDIQQVDYKDRFTVFNTLRDTGNFCLDRLGGYIEKLRDTKILFSERLRYLCETSDLSPEDKKIVAQQASESFDKYYNLLGAAQCKAAGYNATYLRKKIEDLQILSGESISEELSKVFQVDQKYTNKEAKEKVKGVYEKLGVNKAPKASDLSEYYEIKTTKFPVSGKWENGIEILGVK